MLTVGNQKNFKATTVFRFQTRVASSESLIIAHSIENATAWIQHPMARVASQLVTQVKRN